MLQRQWSSESIHDTVAAILRDPAYTPGIRESLISRFWQQILRWLDVLSEGLSHAGTGIEVAVAAAVVLALALIARVVFRRRFRDSLTGTIGRRQSAVVDQWVAAESLAADGRYVEAVHALYAAVLDHLAGPERLVIHPSKTTGDYVRALRRQGSPAAMPFQQFGRHFDHVMFGMGICDASEYGRFVAEARAMTEPRSRVAA